MLQLWCKLISNLASQDDPVTLSFREFHDTIVDEAQNFEDLEEAQESSDPPSAGVEEYNGLMSVVYSIPKYPEVSGSTDEANSSEDGEADNEKEGENEEGGDDEEEGTPTLRIPDMVCFQKLATYSESRVCVTARGYTGITGLNARIGDHVSIIFGIDTVRVLRTKGEFFENVGTISLLDLTDDDVLEAAKSGPSEITLC
jgi:hypothetical protein